MSIIFTRCYSSDVVLSRLDVGHSSYVDHTHHLTLHVIISLPPTSDVVVLTITHGYSWDVDRHIRCVVFGRMWIPIFCVSLFSKTHRMMAIHISRVTASGLHLKRCVTQDTPDMDDVDRSGLCPVPLIFFILCSARSGLSGTLRSNISASVLSFRRKKTGAVINSIRFVKNSFFCWVYL